MSDGGPKERLSIEEYAALQMALSEGDRPALLAEHGLDEEAWDAIDDAMQERLSAAMTAEADGVPPLLARYDEALRRARAQDRAPMPLAEFARATAALAAGGDPTKTLERLGIQLDVYLRASRFWTPRLATDPALAEEFQASSKP